MRLTGLLLFCFSLFAQNPINMNGGGGGGGTTPAVPPFIYPESFGAIGDGVTDDTAAIMAAHDSLTSGGSIVFAAKTYKTTSVLTITNNYVNLVGAGSAIRGAGVTRLLNTATTGDFIKFSGSGTGGCATGGAMSQSISGMTLTRETPATAGGGIVVSKGCGTRIKDILITDSFGGVSQSESAEIIYENVLVVFSTSVMDSRIGWSFAGQNVSTRLTGGLTAGTGSGITGFATSGCNADLFVTDFEVADSVDYGIDLNNSVSGLTCAENMRFTRTTLDLVNVIGVRVTGYTYANTARPSVVFSDLYYASLADNAIGFDIESSVGVSLSQCIMYSPGANAIGVKINASQQNVITGCKIDATPYGISLVNSNNNTIVNNVIGGTVTHGTTIGINVVSGAAVNIITGNQFHGYTTTGILIDVASTGNVAWPNMQDAGGHVTMYSNLGANNTVTGLGGGQPSVATCGTIGTNSTNSAGFITSGTSGTCAPVITFSLLLSGQASTGWNCIMLNQTTPANPILQTAAGSTTTTAGFTGTTVSGDVLKYQCTAY